jgi:hypothetical protein
MAGKETLSTSELKAFVYFGSIVVRVGEGGDERSSVALGVEA